MKLSVQFSVKVFAYLLIQLKLQSKNIIYLSTLILVNSFEFAKHVALGNQEGQHTLHSPLNNNEMICKEGINFFFIPQML